MGQSLSVTCGKSVSSTNKTDCHDINEILLKVALNIITLTLITYSLMFLVSFLRSDHCRS